MKEKIRRFEDLIAWQKARVFASDVFRIASKEPFARDFPIRNQICGAALSISSNIAGRIVGGLRRSIESELLRTQDAGLRT